MRQLLIYLWEYEHLLLPYSISWKWWWGSGNRRLCIFDVVGVSNSMSIKSKDNRVLYWKYDIEKVNSKRGTNSSREPNLFLDNKLTLKSQRLKTTVVYFLLILQVHVDYGGLYSTQSFRDPGRWKHHHFVTLPSQHVASRLRDRTQSTDFMAYLLELVIWP